MAAYWIIYRNNGFELTQPPKRLIRYRVITDSTGARLHLDKHHRTFGDDTVHLITYTHQTLTRSQVTVLTRMAYRFARGKPTKHKKAAPL